MNLKEAFRYQNKIRSFMETAQNILAIDANITTVQNTYLRHKLMAEMEDETVTVVPDAEFHDRITKVVKFLIYLLNEKERLSVAIRKSKAGLDFDVDGEVSLNATRQSVAETLTRMNDLRNSEQIISGGGTGYRFNVDGNQVPYRCDVKRVTTINYDRNVIRSELTKLYKKADEISAKIDLSLVTSSVEYNPPFEINISFADAFDSFTGKEEKE